MKKNKLYLRILKHIDLSVMCVNSDQKVYYDAVFGKSVAFSSGQQIKHCILSGLLEERDETPATFQMNFEINNKNKLEQKEITQPCDPTYTDQVIGGYMSAPKKTKNTKDESDNGFDIDDTSSDSTTTLVLKRRSPLSVSAMTPLHVLLCSKTNPGDEKSTHDRSDSLYNNDTVSVKRGGKTLSETELDNFLNERNITLSKRKLVSSKTRTSGFYKYDIGIDLNKLFRVSISKFDREISDEIEQKLIEYGWIEKVIKGVKYLEMPKELQAKMAKDIASAIIYMEINSNQSGNFDTMPIVAIAVSKNSQKISNTIYGEIDENETSAKLVINTNNDNVNLFLPDVLKSYIPNVKTTQTAIDDAIECVANEIMNYYNE